MTVDHHGPLDQLVGTLQEVMARDDAGVVDEYVHLSHLPAHLLRCGIHTLALPYITHIGVDLRLERWDFLYPSNRSCREKGGGDKRQGKIKIIRVNTAKLGETV